LGIIPCGGSSRAQRKTCSEIRIIYSTNIDKLVKSMKTVSFVIPAKAGIQ
jgi:hypothetical protein